MSKAKRIKFFVDVPADPDDENNKEVKKVELEVKSPNLAQVQGAQEEYNRAFDRAIRSNAPMRVELKAVLESKKLLEKERQEKEKLLEKERNILDEMVKKLEKGGQKLTEARQLALDIRKQRTKIVGLTEEERIAETNTAEALAESARFNWFVAHCTVYPDTGKPFFLDEKGENTVEAYLEQANQEYAIKCASNFGALQYGLEPNFQVSFPENKFLIKWKFARPEDARLINRQGHLINDDGKLVNEKGFLVDENENEIDSKGVPLDKEKAKQVEIKAVYLDEDGEPLEEPALA